MECGKITYKSASEAQVASKHLPEKMNKKIRKIYYCHDCNGWHMTSQKPKKRNRYLSSGYQLNTKQNAQKLTSKSTANLRIKKYK